MNNENLEVANEHLKELTAIKLNNYATNVVIGSCLIHGFTAVVMAICYLADVMWEIRNEQRIH